MQKNKAIFSAFIYSVIFGFSFIFTKMTLDLVNSIYHLLALRFLTAFLILSLLIIFGLLKVNYHGKHVHRVIILSIIQPVIYFTFETKGISLLSSTQTGIMMACIPIFVIIFARILLKEKTHTVQNFFIVLSVLGAVVLSLGSFGNKSIMGMIFLLIAVCAAGIYSVSSRNLSSEFSAFELTYAMMGTGAVVFNAISISTDGIRGYLDPLMHFRSIFGIIYLGAFSSVLAFFLMNYTFSKLEVSKTAVFANLTTGIAAIAGVIFLGEVLEINHIVGGIMILTGVYGARRAAAKAGGTS